MRVTLIIFSLMAGGAERVMAAMASYWAEMGWTVTLLTLDSGEVPPFYALHPDVCHLPLGLAGLATSFLQGIRSNFQRVRGLRAAIRRTKPDVVISLMSETNVTTLLATVGMDVPVLVQEQNDPFHQALPRQWEVLRRRVYPRATHVVVLTERSLSFFSPTVRKRARVIANPAMVSVPPRTPRADDCGAKTVIAMGRFVPQKGFDMLLAAFAQIADRHPDWSLEILGDGALRGKLEEQALALGLRERIRLPGTTKEPHAKLQRADLFVMSSRFEGFPLSLCEAMACGLPVVCFDCPTGPAEIIRDGLDGVLVPAENVAALAEAMDRLMSDAARRAALAIRAPEVLERFSLKKIMGQWEALIAESLPPKRAR
ncbi:MAG: glycosyltransferase family 4 protein [Chthoniobacter sp.]|nr:glycosyltransferase family 4 protein [Chthoniobacter sp.]